MTDLDGEEVRTCQDCGGLRMDVADLNRLLLHHDLPGLESLGGRVVPDGGSAVCRDCLIDMMRIEGRDRHEPIHYETCEACGGVFVEAQGADTPDTLQAAHGAIVSFFRQFAGKRKRA
jgi:hypothetical protein